MDREEVDRELNRLREEKDRISAALLDLDSHGGHQLLQGAELSGATLALWEESQERIKSLWRVFDAYSTALDRAAEQRGTGRIGQSDLAEVSQLLTGRSIELRMEEVPLAQRTLLGPTNEQLTLNGAVARMTQDYEKAAESIARADAAWSALLPPLSEAEEKWTKAGELLAGVANPGHARIGAELAEARKEILRDPLGSTLGRVAAIARDLAKLENELREIARVREGYDERVAQLGSLIEQITAAEDKARQVGDVVIVKIANPALPDLTSRTPLLRSRLEPLGSLRSKGQWPELAASMSELEAAAREALAYARGATRSLEELLERREELRGRLGAYRAKAGRMGYAEDADLERLYRQAREILWAAPCDLRQATVALATYQRAIGERQ